MCNLFFTCVKYWRKFWRILCRKQFENSENFSPELNMDLHLGGLSESGRGRKPQRYEEVQRTRKRQRKGLIMLACVSVAVLFGSVASADWITEVGMGYKSPTSSFLFHPNCYKLTHTDPRISGERASTSCGGKNPVFVGWPIAWNKCFNGGAVCARVGWFHLSSWFDRSGEIHMDCVCVSTTFNWSQMRRN